MELRLCVRSLPFSLALVVIALSILLSIATTATTATTTFAAATPNNTTDAAAARDAFEDDDDDDDAENVVDDYFASLKEELGNHNGVDDDDNAVEGVVDDADDENGNEDEIDYDADEASDEMFEEDEDDDNDDDDIDQDRVDEILDDDDEAEEDDDTIDDDDDVQLPSRRRYKRFVVTRGNQHRRGRNGKKKTSTTTKTTSSSTSDSRGKEAVRSVEGGPFSSRKKFTLSRKRPTSSSNSRRRNGAKKIEKQKSPDKPVWQIKWPKRGKKIRTAIRENELFKDEVMKLKLKIGALNEEQKTEILDAHNKYRGKLPGVRGYPISEIPRAQDMQKMVWDKDLEKKAKIHAEKCLFAHDTRKERHLDNLIVGQNIAVDTSPHFAKTAVANWYNEIALCKWDLSGEGEAKRQKKRCTEFSQLVWANTSRVGCAAVWCPEVADWDNTGYNLVCNYGPGSSNLHKIPYTPAKNKEEICKKCPGKCRNNLCDCGGKVCYNGGSLDVATCQCSCHATWDGATCLEKNCPPTDPDVCGLPYPKGYPKPYCNQYIDVKQKCPYMCGVCTGAKCGGKRCVNGGTLDLKNCQCKCKKIFTGDTCNKLHCPEKDSWFCGKTWDKSYCRRIITAQFECPYMCNICKK